MDSPTKYVLEEFGIIGNTERSWGYHIRQEDTKGKLHELGFNSFEAVYALPMDGKFLLVRRQETVRGREDVPLGVRNLDQVEEIERILYGEITEIAKKFGNRFVSQGFVFRRKVVNKIKRQH